eukprot:8415812-Pyramimonas_sp.AAC.1
MANVVQAFFGMASASGSCAAHTRAPCADVPSLWKALARTQPRIRPPDLAISTPRSPPRVDKTHIACSLYCSRRCSERTCALRPPA